MINVGLIPVQIKIHGVIDNILKQNDVSELSRGIACFCPIPGCGYTGHWVYFQHFMDTPGLFSII